MGAINLGHPNIGTILVIALVWGPFLYCMVAGVVGAIRERGDPEPLRRHEVPEIEAMDRRLIREIEDNE